MHPLLNTAIKAARKAGTVILRHADHIDRLNIESKGRNDFVSEVDRMAEAEIIQVISNAYPDHAILAEESGELQNNESESKYKWIIDPLDGTTNFLHGYPQYAVSIAVSDHNKLDQAVVFDPLRDELFIASRGKGAQLNDKKIRVSKATKMESALLGTGFPFKDFDKLDLWVETFKQLLPETSGVRRAGSAALDLAHVACGRLDGFWEFGLKPWDMAAGCLLIQEAGGITTDFDESDNYLGSGNIIAGSPKIYEQMVKILSVQANLQQN